MVNGSEYLKTQYFADTWDMMKGTARLKADGWVVRETTSLPERCYRVVFAKSVERATVAARGRTSAGLGTSSAAHSPQRTGGGAGDSLSRPPSHMPPRQP